MFRLLLGPRSPRDPPRGGVVAGSVASDSHTGDLGPSWARQFSRESVHGSVGSPSFELSASPQEAAANPRGPLLREVAVIEADAEWGCNGPSSDSDDSDTAEVARHGHRRSRPSPRFAAAATPHFGAGNIGARSTGSVSCSSRNAGGGAPGGGDLFQVDVVALSSEWAGGANFSDSSASHATSRPEANAEAGSGLLRRGQRRGSVLQSVRGLCFSASDGDRRQCLDGVRFLILSAVHMVDIGLRTLCLLIYAWHGMYLVFLSLLPWQVLGVLVATYITFHDADVLLSLHWIRGRCARLRCCIITFTCLVFGCCQTIQVKRAWARQIQTAEVMTDMDGGAAAETQSDGEASTDAPRFLSFNVAERIMPVGLLTGVPFLLIHWLRHTAEADYKRLDMYEPIFFVLNCTSFILAVTVSLGFIEIDVSVSLYVLNRYHLDPTRRGRRAGRLQCLYPLAHIAFRYSEVLHRVLVITCCVAMVHSVAGGQLAFLAVFLDYVVGVAILYKQSPAREHFVCHLVAGVALLVADLTYFVDVPSFAAPAKRISFAVALWRAVGVLVFCAMYLLFLLCTPWDLDSIAGVGERWTWDFAFKLTLAATFVHYLLRFSPIMFRIGDDIHTASHKNRLDRVKRLLSLLDNDQVLDVNAVTKDAKGMTPLMFAAQAGNTTIVDQLVEAGASTNAADTVGDTPLHFAARNMQLDTCQCLLKYGADPSLRNLRGETPEECMPMRKSEDERRGALVSALQTSQHHLPGDSSCSSHTQGTEWAPGLGGPEPRKYYCVRAAPCRGVQLRGLFPDAAEDDAPPPRELHSVSALLVSRAAGPLAHRVLACLDSETHTTAGIPLGALRKVRELGKGGFGRVIEVELPGDAATTFFRRPVRPRRFALKLQLKQEDRHAYSEVQALRRLDHPFIVRLERAFQTPKFFALLLELCPTDLNRELCKSTESGYCAGLPAEKAAKYLGQVLLALTHLHKRMKIVYRDMKPENVLISRRDEAKLTDFGLAKVVTSAQRMTMCGTVGFLPPELTQLDACAEGESLAQVQSEEFPTHVSAAAAGWTRSDPFKMDAYSFGVTLQVSLLGEDGARRKTVRRKGPMMLPLHLTELENLELLTQLVSRGRLSKHALDLLEGLLRFEPGRRTALCDVVDHRFFLEGLQCDDLEEELVRHAKDPESP